MLNACRRTFLFALMVLATAWASADVAAQSQTFPAKREQGGLSAFVLPPSHMLDPVPDGWQFRRGANYGNSAIGDESLTPTRAGAVMWHLIEGLPEADYTVSILARGSARARLFGADEWVEIKSEKPNAYEWFEIGRTTEAEGFEIEIESTGGSESFFYGGLLAEGSVMPVIAVEPVVEKIREGGPATVVLLGDSVTENFGGTGGGASAFERGVAGLMLAYLEKLSGKEVDYVAHREPPMWAGIDRKAEPGRLPTAEIDGETVYDARQELDPERSIHLINIGKGGAASDWGWSRMKDLVIEDDYFDGALPKEQRKRTARYGLDRYHPDLVFVNFGTNDVNASHADWTVEDYLFHMRVLATMLQYKYKAAVVLSTPHRWTQGLHLSPDRQPALVEALRRFCDATGIALADVYAQYGDDAGDGIHPNDAGHQRTADAYIAALRGE